MSPDEKEPPSGEGGNIPYHWTPPESDEREVDFRHYLLAILNRRWMILILTIIIVASTAVYSFLQTPVYRSKAVVDISPPPTYIMLPDSSQSLFVRNESFLNTQYRLLKGKGLARQVAEALSLTKSDLKKSGGFKGTGTLSQANKDEELTEVASPLLKMLQVAPVVDTNLCDIVFTTPDPKLSMILANTWAQTYAANRIDSMQQYTRTTEELLLEQVKSIQGDIEETQKTLHEYSLKHDIVKLDKNRSVASEKLSDLTNSMTTAASERIAAEVRLQALRSSSHASIPEVMANHAVQQKKSEYASLQREYAEKSKMYKSDYPAMVRLRGQIEQFQGEMNVVVAQAYQEVLASAQTQYREAAVKENALKNQLDQARQASSEEGTKEFGYDQLVMEIENKKQLLTMLLQKQSQTDVSAQVQQKATPTTRIVETADLPKDIYSPNIKKNLLFALLAGFAGCIGLALLLDYFDRSLKTAEDVEYHLRLPYLGMVPFYIAESGNGDKGSTKALAKKSMPAKTVDRYAPYHLSANDSGSLASEAIKTVRTSILLAFPGAPPRSILVTSSRAGEGKTFISSNLAVALTQLDKRVVIVDADMRNPSLHRAWGLQNNIGLSIYLTSDISIPSVLRVSPTNHQLFLLSSGPKTPRPAELLASNRFENLLRELEKQFDFVVIDSPPVLPVADSVILASRVQSVLMVVRGGATPRDVIKMAQRKLAASSAIIAGTVLNGIDLADPYYYYRYYSDYYAHYYYGGTQKPPDNGNH